MDVTELREELGLSMSELARALGLPVDDVVAWESGERFPTRRSVERMRRLQSEHRNGSSRDGAPREPTASGGALGETPWGALADPELWALFRKLAASPELRARVLQLADEYPDPAEGALRQTSPRRRSQG